MVIAGTLGGMVWGAIPALLKTRFNASEILVSLMLTYVATLFLSYLVHGPLMDPEGFNFPQSRLFHDSALLPTLIPFTRLHLGAAVALFAVVAGWFVMARTLIGFQVKVIGLTPAAGGYAGFSQKKVVWMAFLTSGGLAGMAGLFEVGWPHWPAYPHRFARLWFHGDYRRLSWSLASRGHSARWIAHGPILLGGRGRTD